MQMNFLPPLLPVGQPGSVRSPELLPQFAGNQALAAAPDTGQAVPVVNTAASDQAANQHNEQSSQYTPEMLADSLKRLNDTVTPFNSDLQFTTDEETDARVVRVIDRTTKEVIRQIPSEEAVKLAQALERLKGLLVRDKA